MEDLNKTQVVLLTLFITFVTSVTTGIVTVTLLQQAPPGVTQTINKVVEHTIEKITPVTTTVKETKVVQGQEDQIISVASQVKPAIARIIFLDNAVAVKSVGGSLGSADIPTGGSDQSAAVADATNSSGSNEAGTGFVVSSDGLVVTSYGVIPDQNVNYGVMIGDRQYTAGVVYYNKNDGMAILKISHDSAVKFYAPDISTSPVVLGQTVIVLGRDLARYTVSVGLVASLKAAGSGSLPSFKTTVKSDDTNIGGPLLASDGSVIGLNLSNGGAIPVELLKSRLGAMAGTSTTAVKIQ